MVERPCPACSCCGGVSGRRLCGQLMILPFLFWTGSRCQTNFLSILIRWALVTRVFP